MRALFFLALFGCLALGNPLSAAERLETQLGPVSVTTVVDGLSHPWGMAFLPDGRLLVTERPGRLRIVGTDGSLSQPVSGTPEVFASGQGGLLDVVLDPDFADTRLVYLSFAEPGQGGASTAVARGRLTQDDRLEDTEVIFRQTPKVSGGNHFGSRLVFAWDGSLFVTTGERFKFDPAQDPSNTLGTVVRIMPDGSVPTDNPFADGKRALPEIWSYGHRNIQAAALHPDSGQLWIGEMGPRGGDELNLPQAGKNYGWPVVSWGEHYSGEDIPDPPTRPEFAAPIHHWTPSIAPSGMAFYTGAVFPKWQGDVLIGSLVQRLLVRLDIDGETVAGEEHIGIGSRVRDVEQGPEGAVFLLTDEGDGKVLKLTPAQ